MAKSDTDLESYVCELSRGGRMVTLVVTGPGGTAGFWHRLDGVPVDEVPTGSPAAASDLCRRINEHVGQIRDAARSLGDCAARTVDGMAQKMAERHGARKNRGKAS